MRYFKQTRWFEFYLEIRRKRCLDRFASHRRDGGTWECWVGGAYFVICVYPD
jgi:hypothetical protein